MKISKSRSEEKIIQRGESTTMSHCQSSPSQKFIRLGVCAMSKKIQAKPMQEILKRLQCKLFQIIIIDDEYWSKPIKFWPVVDALICFYSEGFPYTKAWKYVEDTKPMLINDLDKQQILWDRTLVYQQLKKYNIPTTKHYFVRRKKETLRELYEKHNSSIDMDFDNKKELIRISQRQEHSVDDIDEIRLSIGGSGSDNNSTDTALKPVKKTSVQQQRRTNNLLDISPCKSTSNQPKRNKSSKRKISNSISRHPINILNEMFDEVDYEDYEVQEFDDYIMIGSNKLKRPFVEKPFNAQNHQVCIYYPQSDGGGRKMLFRKQKNCCSSYQQGINNIRTDGNYIYEEYLATNGFDIKVYTVGPYYMHAEARKSPGLDGVVQRNGDGKQKRYPVFLTPEEKFMAQKIVKAFDQQICGFDILRCGGKSYVCDVNGWSFVKTNHLNYYDDCATLLKRMVVEKLMPARVSEIDNRALKYGNFMNYIPNSYKPPTEQIMEQQEELRSIVVVFRHGDRSPKQKMKLTISDPRFLSFFKDNAKQVKLKDPTNLTKLLEITQEIFNEMKPQDEDYLKITQLKSVLEIGGHFQGLNRKVQMKVIEREKEDESSPNKMRVKKAVLILKWGGQLTERGKRDAIQLGKYFRLNKYSQDEGLLSMHSSYRHDLKTYSSDESRCLKTAAAFLQGYLQLESGDLTSIINSMVIRNKKAQVLLDCAENQNPCTITQQQRNILENLLNCDDELETSFSQYFKMSSVSSKMAEVIKRIGNPVTKLNTLLQSTAQLTSSIAKVLSAKNNSYYINSEDVNSQSNLQPQCESLWLMYKRWCKLQKDLYDSEKRQFIQSKIPDIYDSILYDVKNNKKVLEKIYPNYPVLLQSAQILAYFVVPNEYGVERKTRLRTAQNIVTPLCKKILADLMFWKDGKFREEEHFWKYQVGKVDLNDKHWRHVRTRLYFTSSSHIYSLFNMLTYGNKGELLDSCQNQIRQKVRRLSYIGYLSNIQLKLYENLAGDKDNPKRFRLELSFCPQYDPTFPEQKLVLGHSRFTIQEIQTFFKTVLNKEWTKQTQE